MSRFHAFAPGPDGSVNERLTACGRAITSLFPLPATFHAQFLGWAAKRPHMTCRSCVRVVETHRVVVVESQSDSLVALPDGSVGEKEELLMMGPVCVGDLVTVYYWYGESRGYRGFHNGGAMLSGSFVDEHALLAVVFAALELAVRAEADFQCACVGNQLAAYAANTRDCVAAARSKGDTK